ncbi:hypothetical protein GYMLUDRAFT_42064 [Collybiopsis luxurians FD-317 M1]|uniref:RlpA-like protein double-psi beta-barrel domain-containing protein n=1 Tax=Collybiopsis luxurians FD-317 M1 TaxID=944289 RepID=A0A0D0BFH4_9AGAR|nr:hypothetical protein GYMLUDRAFT_42064 [Collybiopsis luxurians FD-317 M1]
MKFFSQSALVVVAAMFGAAQANWGYAFLDGTPGITTESCGTVCPWTEYKVALPTPLANPAKCCSTVTIAYNGLNLEGTYTDICTSCPTVNHGVDGNITLSAALYDQLQADTPFVTWNVVN